MSNGRVLVICPSRDRPQSLYRMIESFVATSTHARLVVVIDDDQTDMYDLGGFGDRVSCVVKSPPKAGPAATYNAVWSSTPAEVYGALTDDCEFLTHGWDDVVLELREKMPGRVGLIAPWSNVKDFEGTVIDEIDYVQFSFITKEWGAALGYFTYPKCLAYGWDTILEVLADSTSIERVPREVFSICHRSLPSDNVKQYMAQDTYESVLFFAQQRRKAIERLRKAMSR
jgi:hypothetical protein